MNQEIEFGPAHYFGGTSRIRFRKRQFISLKGMDLKLYKRLNVKVSSKNLMYHLGGISPTK